MKRKVTGFLALSLVAAMTLTACSGGATPSPSSSVNPDDNSEATSDYGSLKYLRMCAGTQGATWTTVGSAMMEYANAAMPISASNGPGGSVANCRAVAAGESELGWAFTATVNDAYCATGVFSEDKPMENLNHVMSIFPSMQHFVVAADSSIQSLSDLNGKIVNFNPVTETCYTVCTQAFDSYGITQDTIEAAGGTVTLTRFNEASELMKNGQLDLWTATVAAPAATCSELAFSPGIRLLSIDDEKMPDVLSRLPGFTEMIIPAGTYEGVDTDTVTVGTLGSVFTNTDVPADVIYDFLKTMYDRWDDLKAINPTAFGDLTVENWLDGATVPLHPGAQRFYEEMGLLK